MAHPRRRRCQPTDDWPQLRLVVTSRAQETYELLRPIGLFGQPPRERAAETGVSARTLRRKAARFAQLGMQSLFADPAPTEHDDRRADRSHDLAWCPDRPHATPSRGNRSSPPRNSRPSVEAIEELMAAITAFLQTDEAVPYQAVVWGDLFWEDARRQHDLVSEQAGKHPMYPLMGRWCGHHGLSPIGAQRRIPGRGHGR